MTATHAETMFDYETDLYTVEYAGGWMFITDKRTGVDYPVRLENPRGQCVTQGQFRDGVRTHGVDQTCRVFIKLAASKEEMQ